MKSKSPQTRATTKSKRKKLIFEAHFADKTPEGFWEEVYYALRNMGVFDFDDKK